MYITHHQPLPSPGYTCWRGPFYAAYYTRTLHQLAHVPILMPISDGHLLSNLFPNENPHPGPMHPSCILKHPKTKTREIHWPCQKILWDLSPLLNLKDFEGISTGNLESCPSKSWYRTWTSSCLDPPLWRLLLAKGQASTAEARGHETCLGAKLHPIAAAASQEKPRGAIWPLFFFFRKTCSPLGKRMFPSRSNGWSSL